jgi:DNA-binding CsgD family transcriptional regulator
MRLEQSGLYRALARAADGVMMADAYGRVILWNRAAERLLGRAAAEVLGRPCCDVLQGCAPGGEPVCRPGCPVLAAARQGDSTPAFDLAVETAAARPLTLNVSTLASPPDGTTGALLVHLFREVSPRPAGQARNGHATTTPASSNGSSPLTPREREVLRLLAAGANTKIAAERLGISPATVRNHVQNLLGKLGVHSRLQAVAYANAHGLL